MKSMKWPVVALALAAPIAAAWLLQSRPPLPAGERAAVQAATRPLAVADPVAAEPKVVGAQIGEALKGYSGALDTARNLQAPEILPVPAAHSAGAPDPAADRQPALAAAAALPKIDDKEKIALYFTGSCIGETDPCG